jgi:hypothetical protein
MYTMCICEDVEHSTLSYCCNDVYLIEICMYIHTLHSFDLDFFFFFSHSHLSLFCFINRKENKNIRQVTRSISYERVTNFDQVRKLFNEKLRRGCFFFVYFIT